MMINSEYQKFLNSFYSKVDLEKWNRWMVKYIIPAFDEKRRNEMIKNFGYASLDRHDFVSQYEVYDQLKLEPLLDEELKMFIGFMAGAGFFKLHDLNVFEWLKKKNWLNPYREEKSKDKSIREILEYENGVKSIKLDLVEMPFWKR